ncbi:MAG TPA: SMP-30/gluconolactonase/LRE family protein [Devosia sp.]|nr:SMP-30/gluconolactonase/LRE family protein [Devosia sp.]
MIECVLEAGAALGESPVWDEQGGHLYWVDCLAPAIHRFDPATGEDTSWPTHGPVGSIGLREGGGLVAALKSGFAIYDVGAITPCRIIDIAGEPEGNRLNDGRVDPAGRFWAGSMTGPGRQPVGALFCLDGDMNVSRRAEGMVLSNTLCWSPDGRTMYHGDSFARVVWAWEYDAARGAIANRRVFAEGDALAGIPDGAVVDAEGCLWIAHFSGWTVARYAPTGELLRSIRLPVQNPTCPAFGGPDLSTLYVTSASIGLTPEQRAEQPLAGSLFALDVGVAGLPGHRFSGK